MVTSVLRQEISSSVARETPQAFHKKVRAERSHPASVTPKQPFLASAGVAASPTAAGGGIPLPLPIVTSSSSSGALDSISIKALSYAKMTSGGGSGGEEMGHRRALYVLKVTKKQLPVNAWTLMRRHLLRQSVVCARIRAGVEVKIMVALQAATSCNKRHK